MLHRCSRLIGLILLTGFGILWVFTGEECALLLAVALTLIGSETIRLLLGS